MKRRSNPFVFSKIAIDNHFCGRTKEMNTLIARCETGVNSLVFGRRRFGKSSLIHSTFKALKDEGFLTVYVDLNSILSAEDFALAFYTSAVNALPNLPVLLQDLHRYFSKVTFDFSVNSQGTVAAKTVMAKRSFDEYLKDTIDGLSTFAEQHDLQVVVAFDEFQEIAQVSEVRIDAKLREYIQASDNQISYIFSGSKRHLLSELFHNDSLPMYKMATGLEIDKINEHEFYQFVSEKLNARLSPELFNIIYSDIADGESKLIQQICYELYFMAMLDLSIKDFSIEHVTNAITEILDSESAMYSMLEKKHAPSHRLALRYIAKFDGLNLMSEANLAECPLSKSSLQSALRSLLKSNEKHFQVIDFEHERYFLPDRSFELYLKREETGRVF